ncbi:50S ribosomal protein L20 [Alkaliphilus oremlandii]|uniref:Large ribosomal subunit protein bL20 n=1 Tax=Alkaliphilus oremlandii (strain OhILAs) TaxID=350688 RepID=RL20_ALKOO|nr:50S ribosomal protein L20 [Alkaliphilus oremlandii]A8MI82.1 RecName: Full=Large ribosomal subunit protein bL20; AltName: Full=50S ribosomal protein L20 [Alkaliphilus oremlandii OhILAs]ABW19514.1 ribosomal protein L20 [Alkaliphilus oremlandii OhILAs]
MARVKTGKTAHKRHKKVLKLAKGFRGARSKLFRPANQFVMKSLKYAYIGRKLRKRDFRKLWITRINAATRANGLSYSKFMNGLKLAGIDMNRKVLSEMAIYDKEGFAQLVETAKQKLNA